MIGEHRKWEESFLSFASSSMKWELWNDMGIWNLSSRAWLHPSHLAALGFQPGDLGLFEPPSLYPPTLNVPGKTSKRQYESAKWSQSYRALCTVWPLPCEKCQRQVGLQYIYAVVYNNGLRV